MHEAHVFYVRKWQQNGIWLSVHTVFKSIQFECWERILYTKKNEIETAKGVQIEWTHRNHQIFSRYRHFLAAYQTRMDKFLAVREQFYEDVGVSGWFTYLQRKKREKKTSDFVYLGIHFLI